MVAVMPSGLFFAGVLLVISLTAATVYPASAQSPPVTQECRSVMAHGAAFLEQCGDRLNAWSLKLREFKREMGSDLHGRFSFYCPIEPMCEGEPSIGGRFVNRAEWQSGAKDERAIFELEDRLRIPLRPVPPMPNPACPVFDVSFAGTAGRAVCFGEPGSNGSRVVVVAADDRVAFLLRFYQQDKSPDALKEKVVLEWLPRFEIERATGDAALLKWFR
jgi:hypothetical protein